ncbi:Unknown protein, partial [Striga hermonthica]
RVDLDTSGFDFKIEMSAQIGRNRLQHIGPNKGPTSQYPTSRHSASPQTDFKTHRIQSSKFRADRTNRTETRPPNKSISSILTLPTTQFWCIRIQDLSWACFAIHDHHRRTVKSQPDHRSIFLIFAGIAELKALQRHVEFVKGNVLTPLKWAYAICGPIYLPMSKLDSFFWDVTKFISQHRELNFLQTGDVEGRVFILTNEEPVPSLFVHANVNWCGAHSHYPELSFARLWIQLLTGPSSIIYTEATFIYQAIYTDTSITDKKNTSRSYNLLLDLAWSYLLLGPAWSYLLLGPAQSYLLLGHARSYFLLDPARS